MTDDVTKLSDELLIRYHQIAIATAAEARSRFNYELTRLEKILAEIWERGLTPEIED